LWGRLDLLDELPAYKVRPADPNPPYKFETGTQNHEGIAGITAAIDYLAALGEQFGRHFAPELTQYPGRRKALKQAMQAISAYERSLFNYLLTEVQKIPGLTVYGLAEPDQRCPTLAFTRAGFSPQEIAAHLGEQGIFVWHGNYYALSVTERLGLEETGGMVRVGLAHYNTRAEVERLVTALREM